MARGTGGSRRLSIPALEGAHSVAHAPVKGRETKTGTILVDLGGCGEKDLDHVFRDWGCGDDE